MNGWQEAEAREKEREEVGENLRAMPPCPIGLPGSTSQDQISAVNSSVDQSTVSITAMVQSPPQSPTCECMKLWGTLRYKP